MQQDTLDSWQKKNYQQITKLLLKFYVVVLWCRLSFDYQTKNNKTIK